MKHIKYLLIATMALILGACSSDSTSDPDPTPGGDARAAFIARNEIGVYQYNTPLYAFNKPTEQLVITPSKRIIRIQGDNGMSYAQLTLNTMPEVSGAGVKASFKNNISLPNIEFEALELLRKENGQLWLWNEKNQMGLILPWIE